MSEHLLITLAEGLAPVALLIALGYVWRLTAPGGLDALSARRAINMLVMYAFYPGLAYHVVSHARFGADFWWVPLYTWTGLLAAAGIAWWVFARSGLFPDLGRRQLGALILACSFGNILSIGLSVLLAALWVRRGALRDLCRHPRHRHPVLESRRGPRERLGFHWRWSLSTVCILPQLRATAAGLGFRRRIRGEPARTAQPGAHSPHRRVARPGGCSRDAANHRHVAVPGRAANEMTVSIVLLAGMPTMMATILLSERFGLDTELLASVMVATTLLYFAVLPLWLWVLL